LGSFNVFETAEFSSQLKRLGKQHEQFLQRKLTTYVYPQLRLEPRFGQNIKKLVNYAPPTWRYRVGNFRIFYTIDESENTVLILTVDLRRDAYK